MKSPEVYAALKDQLAPLFQAAGFKRAKATLSWAQPQQNSHLVVWFQVSQDGWDSYAGSKFTVEFQLSNEAIVGARHIHRQRFPTMLDASGREEIRTIQNKVIASLRYPPPHHPPMQVSDLRSWYLQKFQKLDQPYGDRDDIWLRYGSRHDVTTWASFIASKLPDCLLRAESWG
jgi:hypothetical protein